MTLSDRELGDAILAQLRAQLLDAPAPPADVAEGLSRLADAIATGLVPYLTANAVVTVDGQTGRLS